MRPHLTIALASMLLMPSCGNIQQLGGKTKSQLSRAGSAVTGGIKTLASTVADPFGPDINVVEVREADLKNVPDGSEKALAYQTKIHQRRMQQQRANQPVDLPDFNAEDGSLDDTPHHKASLLPPKD